MTHTTTTTASNSFSAGQTGVLRKIAAVVIGSLFVAACAHISVPLFFTPVPVTLQPFAVLLLGLLLDPASAAAALMLYLLEGAAGAPVFTPQGPLGILRFYGLTGGYLLSYPLVAALTSMLYHRLRLTAFRSALIAAGFGSLVILGIGATWFAVASHQSIYTVLSLAVVPFLPGDVLKVIAAAGIASGIARFRRLHATETL